MSVFRVKLNNIDQGKMDLQAPAATPGLGTQFAVSKQRQVFIMGPNLRQRLLNDGETFTDCNYYKKFCYPQCSYENAILEIVTDDGSTWPEDATTPIVLNETIAQDTAFAANTYDLVATYGGPAIFCQIENRSATTALSVRLNGQASAVFTLDAGDTQIFNAGDLTITEIAFANSQSGGDDVDVQMILSVASTCNS